MTESSTLTDPRPVAIDYGCPDWCERTDHDADEITAGENAVHYGPSFGLVRIEYGRAGCLGHNNVDSLDDLTAQELRQLAGDALAAAEWLEARQ